MKFKYTSLKANLWLYDKLITISVVLLLVALTALATYFYTEHKKDNAIIIISEELKPLTPQSLDGITSK